MNFLTQSLILKLYLIGFAISFLVQTVTQSKFGGESAWGINKGWQTEIAIWNVFAIVMLSALIERNFESDIVIAALFIMSFGFGINHLIAARKHNNRKSNVAGAASNFFGLLVILLWVALSGR